MGTKGESEDPAVDLFGRWLEHHAGESVPADPGEPAPRTSSTTADPGRPALAARTTEPAQPTQPTPATQPAPAAGPPASATPARPEPPRRGNTDIVFPPKRGSRTVVGLLLLGSLVITGIAAAMAFEERTTFSIGVACTLGVLTLVLYGVRAGAATTYLTVRGGQLEIERGGNRHVFDLSSRYTRIEEIGRPGQRGWKVAFARYDAAPLIIDSSVVDPAEFSEVLRRYRPD